MIRATGAKLQMDIVDVRHQDGRELANRLLLEASDPAL